MRILITGSRTWTDADTIAKVLHRELLKLELHPKYRDWICKVPAGNGNARPHVVLVSGACPKGADVLCEEAALMMGWVVESHPADWSRFGKRAGYVRNAEMVSLGADLCIAFIKDNSKGATMCADLAEKAGIPVVRVIA